MISGELTRMAIYKIVMGTGIFFFVFAVAKTAWQFFGRSPDHMTTVNEVVSEEAVEEDASFFVEGANKVTQKIQGSVFRGIIDSQTIKQKKKEQ